ncbi:MAG: dodecin domain-containing protein [Candidatus Jettenia sp.]|uniref:Dodecin n=1 Tax=Candidatus Jettenia caeni TaxID=247490 RepID=I3IP55_9BACT|nr:dodecin [Candidatus Jettenia sp. AMX1]MBC6930555.1 dodecin domain-containing protein [Candidatus Jettenia sp.]WKZ15958.1 MAG: dodecin family protein [Candidatus Jettenia caeni]KAA0246932.1 MAG: dodecin domain-containing protein [Candidatus Jettenia sp. AMX1]MCE7882148.1 dodecin domain-containing protein [Candidatus Jettenia sp. AMX1]MCQ3928688.1 dodecin domain-containing protein [Candidatus Jettenia sp.]
MGDHIYKIIELAGSSTTTVEDAIQNAIARASKTIRNMRWFEVIETRGRIENGKVARWEVIIKVGFVLEDTL